MTITLETPEEREKWWALVEGAAGAEIADDAVLAYRARLPSAPADDGDRHGDFPSAVRRALFDYSEAHPREGFSKAWEALGRSCKTDLAAALAPLIEARYDERLASGAAPQHPGRSRVEECPKCGDPRCLATCQAEDAPQGPTQPSAADGIESALEVINLHGWGLSGIKRHGEQLRREALALVANRDCSHRDAFDHPDGDGAPCGYPLPCPDHGMDYAVAPTLPVEASRPQWFGTLPSEGETDEEFIRSLGDPTEASRPQGGASPPTIEGWAMVCKALGMVEDCPSDALAARASQWRSAMWEANETLAAYCPECDPGRCGLLDTVGLLVSDVLDPMRRASEGTTAPPQPEGKTPIPWDTTCWAGAGPEAVRAHAELLHDTDPETWPGPSGVPDESGWQDSVSREAAPPPQPGVCIGRVVSGLAVMPTGEEPAEPSGVPDGRRWWVDTGEGIEEAESRRAAEVAAADAITDCSMQAVGDAEWPERVEGICWGEMVVIEEASETVNADGEADYGLVSAAPESKPSGVPDAPGEVLPGAAQTGPGWWKEARPEETAVWGDGIRIDRSNGHWTVLMLRPGDPIGNIRGVTMTDAEMGDALRQLKWGGRCTPGDAGPDMAAVHKVVEGIADEMFAPDSAERGRSVDMWCERLRAALGKEPTND